MQHGQGQEFADPKDFQVIADLVNAAPSLGSVNDLLSNLDLAQKGDIYWQKTSARLLKTTLTQHGKDDARLR